VDIQKDDGPASGLDGIAGEADAHARSMEVIHATSDVHDHGRLAFGRQSGLLSRWGLGGQSGLKQRANPGKHKCDDGDDGTEWDGFHD
jgi:hypothetical protein